MNQQLQLGEPAARTTDPTESHQAAETKKASNERHIRDIRRWFALYGPATQAECADALVKRGWRWSSTVSACNPKRSGLVKVGTWRERDHNDKPIGSPKGLYGIVTDTLPAL